MKEHFIMKKEQIYLKRNQTAIKYKVVGIKNSEGHAK